MKVKLERENTSQRRAKEYWDAGIYGNVRIGQIITMMTDG
jgi:hypothetical protein